MGMNSYSAAPTAVKTMTQPPSRGGSGGGFRPTGSNLMWDKRVVRGNTYATQVLPLSAQAELAQAERESIRQKKKIEKERKAQRAEASKRSATPEPVDGRKHSEIQTEQYLEELVDRVQEHTVDTQTDPMMDRPPTPVYLPWKTGRDAETQIGDTDLFDFDMEVEPIVEVLVGKTMEQAMLEVLQEEELEQLRQQQIKFEQARKEEEIEVQRLEAMEMRRVQEKQNRIREQQERLLREQQAKAKLAAHVAALRMMSTLEHRVLATLEDEGFFYDSIEREVETQFFPWLMEQTNAELEKKRGIHRLALDVFHDASLL